MQTGSIGSSIQDQCECAMHHYLRAEDETCQTCGSGVTINGGRANVKYCICDVGSFRGDTMCERCDAKETTLSFGSTNPNQCICDVGFSKNSTEDQKILSSCVSCPANSTSTGSVGNEMLKQCLCDANFYLENGFCQSCGSGQTLEVGAVSSAECICYANSYLSDEEGGCISCPEGFITKGQGATSAKNCVNNRSNLKVS